MSLHRNAYGFQKKLGMGVQSAPRKGVAFPRNARFTPGFTLAELLIVIALMVILAVFSTQAVSGLFSAGNVNQAVNGISLTLSQARSYAMAHDTYVWVGFTPSPTASTTLTVGVVGGTAGESTDLTTTSGTPPLPNYGPIVRAQNYPNFTLTKVTAFNWQNENIPAGTDLLTSGTPSSWSFTETVGSSSTLIKFGSSYGPIIQFDPQGEASVVAGTLPHWIQFGLQPNLKASDPNVAVIQVAGLSGQIQVFRP